MRRLRYISATSFSSFSIIELIIVINTKALSLGITPHRVSVEPVYRPIDCLLYLVLLATPIPAVIILEIVIYLHHCPQREDSDGNNECEDDCDLDEPEAAALLPGCDDLGLPPQGGVLPITTLI